MTLPLQPSPSARGGTRLPRRTKALIAIGGVLLAMLTLVRVTITDPRVTVRWQEDVGAEYRTALERRYGLRDGRRVEGAPSTWRYGLAERSRENIRALVEDPAVDDTGYIDRDAFTSEDLDIRVTMSYPFSDVLNRPSDLLELHRSLWLLLAGGLLLWAARSSSGPRRRNLAIATVLLVGAMSVAFPIEPAFVTMGGSGDHTRSRDDFERWFGGRVRYEKHLSQVALYQLYLRLEPTEAAPAQALVAISRVGTAWFVMSALAVGFLERWSALSLRYLGLALLAPATLLYFGWQELGYLSLCVAAFPLLARGLKGDTTRLEAGSAFAGFGTALHGTGLVSLAGAWIAALGTSGRIRERLDRALRVTAWGSAAYLGWLALYLIVLNLPIVPDPGPAAFSSWRPWLADEVREGRVSAAILSATGARDLLMTAWVVGAPLLIVAASLWRRYPHEVRTALWYLPPSVLFVMFRWPYDGVGGGIDLVVGGFPALYALAWVCAHDSKRTNVAALLLVSAHYAFWRVALDGQFLPVQVD